MNHHVNHTTNDSTDIDTDILDALGGTFAGQRMTTSLDTVVARGRKTRNRHRAIGAGIGTSAAALVAAIGVLAPSSGGAAAVHPAIGTGAPVTSATSATASSPKAIDIESAGFSLKSNANGTLSLTLQQLFDPKALKGALDEAGIKADVQLTELADNNLMVRCKPTPGIEELPSKQVFLGPSGTSPNAITIVPSAIPAGAVLSFHQFVHYKPGDPKRLPEAATIGPRMFTGMPDKCVVEPDPNLPMPKNSR
jgi:hypothetical protein